MAAAISCFANNKSSLVCLRVNTQIFRAAGQAAKERGAGVSLFIIGPVALGDTLQHKHTHTYTYTHSQNAWAAQRNVR